MAELFCNGSRLPSREELHQARCLRHTQPVQQALAEGRVAVAGLGGLGSHVAVSLARMGVGRLHLIDFDRVELTNLNRQQYFLSQLGQPKTEALCQLLRQIDPYLDVRIDTVAVTEDNLAALFAEDDIICEAFDRPEAKAMLVQGVLSRFPQKYLVCGSGMSGYFSSNLIHTRQAAAHLYLCGDETHGLQEGLGLMAPRVALCAAHQANMIVRLLLHQTES